MTEDDFVELAKRTAWVFKADRDYLPKTEEDLQEFKPHSWVVAAIRLAYNKGVCDGALEDGHGF